MQGLSPEEHKSLLLSVGTHRSDRRLSPVEVAELLQKTTCAGTTRAECAKALQVGTTQISTFLRLLDLDPSTRHLADWGNADSSSISFSSLAEIARLPLKDHARAASAVLAHGLKWKEVVQLVQIVVRSGEGIEEGIRRTVELRPKVETRHLFLGKIESEELRAQLAALDQLHRNKLLATALEQTLGPSAPQFAGRLGAQEFTIVGSSAPSTAVGVTADELEKRINDSLRSGVEPA